ncbi:MAG: MoaD/ThiS family protein [Anaerolineae bacterium]|nr:MoaD/ThiS family protein [Anaerolineae bacterium]
MATVELLGILREQAKVRPEDLGPADGKAVADVIQALGLPADLVAFVMVNGRQQPKTYIIQPEDHVILIPLIGGG